MDNDLNNLWPQYPGQQYNYGLRQRHHYQTIETETRIEEKSDENGQSITTKRSTSVSTTSSTDSVVATNSNKLKSPKLESNESENRLNKQDFECPICYDLLCEPVTLLCGHTYCHHCILRWIVDRSNAKYVSLFDFNFRVYSI